MAYDTTISGRWNIEYTSKRIYRGNDQDPGLVYQNTVDPTVDLYSFIQDTFDGAASMDNKVPMSAQTPNAFSMINGWFIDDRSTKYLDDGAIQSTDWTSNVFVCDYTTSVEFAPSVGLTVGGDLDKEIITASYSGTILFVDSGRLPKRVFIRPYNSLQAFDAQEAFTVTGGTGVGTLEIADKGETLYTNLFTLGTIQSPFGAVHIYQSGMNVADTGDVYTWGGNINGGEAWWGNNHIDILLKVKEADLVIDGGVVTPFLRQFSDTYDNFPIDLSAGGRQAAPLATGDDSNILDPTNPLVASGYRAGIDVVFVNCRGDHGGVVSGPFTDFEKLTWTGGKGIFIQVDSGDSEILIGNITGTFPSDTQAIAGATASVTLTKSNYAATCLKAFNQATEKPYNVIVNCATDTLAHTYEAFQYMTTSGIKVTEAWREIGPAIGPWTGILEEVGEEYTAANQDYVPTKTAPFGTFAGGKLFGARGVWVENMDADDVQAFALVDASGIAQNPPNQVSVTVSNTAVGDQVFVARSGLQDGVEKTSFTVNDLGSGAGTITIAEAIPTDTPSDGYIRVYVAVSGTEDRYAYSSWTGSTFTLDAVTTTQDYADETATAYVPFIDDVGSASSTSVTIIQTATRTLVARVRRYGGLGDSIIPYEGFSSLSSTGFSATATRQDDTIVQ